MTAVRKIVFVFPVVKGAGEDFRAPLPQQRKCYLRIFTLDVMLP